MAHFSIHPVNEALSVIIGVLDDEGVLGGNAEDKKHNEAVLRDLVTKGVLVGDLKPLRINIAEYGVILNIHFGIARGNAGVGINTVSIFCIGPKRQATLQKNVAKAVRGILTPA